MKDIGSAFGKIFLYIFAVLAIVYTASLTFQLAGRLVPGNIFMQVMTLIWFDVAALIWFYVMIDLSKGSSQGAIAAAGFAVGLVGSIVMAGGELVLGQNLVAFNDPSKLGWLLIATVVVACIVHISALYAYHLLDPETHNRININNEIFKTQKKAYNNALQRVQRELGPLETEIAQTILDGVKLQLESQVGMHVKQNRSRQKANIDLYGPGVIPGMARDFPSVSHMPMTEHGPMPAAARAAAPGNNGNGNHKKPTIHAAAAQKRNNIHPPSSMNRNVTTAGPVPTMTAASRSNPTPPPSSSSQRS